MSRRSILLVSAVAVFIAGALLSTFIRSSKAQIISATDTNPDPNVFEAYLTAQELDVTIAGQTVHAMVYKDDPPLPFTSSGAGIPAPEIKVKVGETVIIHFQNNLPTTSASIHWHGIELDNDSDGTAVTQDAVLPGQNYTYRFKTFRPGLFWYHPHMLPSNETFAGMYGPIVIENNIESSPNFKGTVVPLDEDTHNLVLSDIQFDAAGNVGKPFGPGQTTTTINELVEMCHLFGEGDPGGSQAACNILAGTTVLVNGENPNAGAPTPKFLVPSGKRIRLRLFNAALSRHFRLKLLDSSVDNKIYRIGGEGGLLDNIKVEGGTQETWDTIYPQGELVLGSGDRADVIVVPSGPQGSIVKLVGNKLPPPFLGDAAANYPDNYPIAFFEISGTSTDTSPAAGDPILELTPENIENIKAAPVNPLVAPAPFGGSSDPTIRVTVDRPDPAQNMPSIDGFSAMLDSNVGNGDFLTLGRPPTARYARVGDVLELSVRNETNAAHPFHMHGFSMQPVRVVDNTTGNTLFTWDYDEFIDTLDVYGGQTFVYRMRIDDRPRSCDQSGGPPGPVLAPCTEGLTGGAVGRWIYHCHIFHHAGLGMMSEVTILPLAPTAAPAAISGQVGDMNGSPISGVVVTLSGGSQTRWAITNTAGAYSFAEVDTNSFYTVTPERANYSFSPNQRSFSLLANVTDATFVALPNAVPSINPLDTSGFFVRQQYLDFLNREPDEAGFNFWVNNIESCSADPQCRALKNIDTSAAFFLSIEFQQTGFLVYRTYQAAYGDRPGAPVPITLNEFKPDTREIGRNVIVNQSGWQQLLLSNQQAYLTEFVQRARFALAFPASMSPAEFVDKLFANAGLTPAANDRSAAISEFGPAITSSDISARARTLRHVAENSTLAQQESNQAFVLMQYFGYLGRDPNSEPDNNFEGYNFWLSKLNRFGGDFQKAEMVKAFLLSGEYRRRFGR